MTTLIIQGDDRYGNQGYWENTKQINQLYADKYKYDYHSFKYNNELSHHNSWTKLLLCLEMINQTNYDIYVWMDSDAHFNHFNTSIEEHLSKANFLTKNGSLMAYHDKPNYPNKPCAGIFYFTKEDKELINNWYNDINHSPERRFQWSWEQGSLYKFIDKISIIDEDTIDLSKDCFIKHITGSYSLQERNKLTKEYYEFIINNIPQ